MRARVVAIGIGVVLIGFRVLLWGNERITQEMARAQQEREATRNARKEAWYTDWLSIADPDRLVGYSIDAWLDSFAKPPRYDPRFGWCRGELSGANLAKADLRDAHFDAANLQHANLEMACLQGASLQRADLRGANLAGAHLQGAALQGADLEDSDLRGAKLALAGLEGANGLTPAQVLSTADWRGARLPLDLARLELAEAASELAMDSLGRTWKAPTGDPSP